ncbi:MAG: O-antigen ligase family protein [Chloroflexia bacterium]|nr:O-antigen ligase family protein [Chloroflexia bacterium]
MRRRMIWQRIEAGSWSAWLLGTVLILLVGTAAGLSVVRYGLLAPLLTLSGLVLALAAALHPCSGLWLAGAIAILLPFGVLPIKLGATPSLLELTLLGLLLGWVLPPLLRDDRRWHFSWPDGLLWAFMALTCFSLLQGWGRGLDASLLHHYFKLLLALLTFFGARQVLRRPEDVRCFLRVLLLAAGLASLLGLALYALPDSLALEALTRLGPLGYPTEGRVLRYVEDDPTGLERAIGTSVDPNSFGGMLALAAAVAAGELLLGRPWRDLFGSRRSRQERTRPVLPPWLLLAILGLLLLCLFLTHSRAALGGFAAGALFLAAARYRRLWWVALVGGLALAVLVVGLGKGGAVVERFRQGIRFEDQANQMRLDEYANAAEILRRYPLLGVGLGQSPDVDLHTGVSSLYLTVVEHMGLLGLAVFLLCVGAAVFQALRLCGERAAVEASAAQLASGHRLALLAGIAAALAIGLLDHYFFNLEFPHMAVLFWSVLGAATAPDHR